MNVYTRQDLSVMQAWPLERKIRVTQAKILEWHHHYGGKVAVSFSGGKDSTVLLDLARVPGSARRVCRYRTGISRNSGFCKDRTECDVAAT